MNAAVVALTAVALTGCSSPFQVITETEFAASLGVDLSMMEILPNGVYIQDRVVGTGPELVYDSEIIYDFTGWLADGTEWDSRAGVSTVFIEREFGAIPGFNEGILGMNEGGTRLLVIPPDQAYGDRERQSASGVVIPAGSILIMEVTLDRVSPPDPAS
ncbi:MAG: FKBP-type peptidyl-prolyl cis-trans isomerase [Gemmatimonadetes bacterium]|nr:FKBP-type peptidyl-prolyl cis-trans isomerase [Gemmatimonadota bacterium]NNL30499.1 FKBP-type peptidyl-prolyl cis-trans isomerase [Gemmatimonadota bacterium]